MKPQLLVAAFVTALLLVSGLIAAACGGGGELTLEEYFQRLKADGEEFDARFAALEERPAPGPDASGEEVAAFVRGSGEGQLAILAEAIDALRNIDPPEEVGDAHEEWLAALEAGRASIEAWAQAIPESPSQEEAEDLFSPGNPGFEEAQRPIFAAFGHVEETCLALQDIADKNNIQVDLKCEEEDGE